MRKINKVLALWWKDRMNPHLSCEVRILVFSKLDKIFLTFANYIRIRPWKQLYYQHFALITQLEFPSLLEMTEYFRNCLKSISNLKQCQKSKSQKLPSLKMMKTQNLRIPQKEKIRNCHLKCLREQENSSKQDLITSPDLANTKLQASTISADLDKFESPWQQTSTDATHFPRDDRKFASGGSSSCSEGWK